MGRIESSSVVRSLPEICTTSGPSVFDLIGDQTIDERWSSQTAMHLLIPEQDQKAEESDPCQGRPLRCLLRFLVARLTAIRQTFQVLLPSRQSLCWECPASNSILCNNAWARERLAKYFAVSIGLPTKLSLSRSRIIATGRTVLRRQSLWKS